MKLLTTILMTLLLLLSSTYTAKVVRVSDGDTITVLTDNKEQIRIKLEGIDCTGKRENFYPYIGTVLQNFKNPLDELL